MASKILSFICHVPGVVPGSYPAVPTTTSSKSTTERRHEQTTNASSGSGHFTAIYENEKFVRFKYISNGTN